MVRLRFNLVNPYDHKAGGRSSSFLKKNELEPKA